MSFLGALRKRWAIRDYIRKLPKLLRDDYGFSLFYAPAQIRATIERYRLNLKYSCYAMSIFTDQRGFAGYHDSIGEHCDYLAISAEIAASHFDGDANFTVTNIMDAFSANTHDGVGGGWHGGADGHGGHGDNGGGH